jgi:hypothetical protein
MDEDLKKAADKHYATEEERLRKLQENPEEIQEFWEAMKGHIQDILDHNLRFYVFDMDLDSNVICAGFKVCCNNDGGNLEEWREKTERKIINSTRFKRVIWEF